MIKYADQFIKEEILNLLVWDTRVDANDINIEVNKGVVQLSGAVSTYTAKNAAEKNAYRVGGVAKVENLIEVELLPEIAIPLDNEITNMIENKLRWDDQIDASGIGVETFKGNVTLTGNVKSFWEKSLAKNLASATKGVRHVKNNLAVVVGKTYADSDIEDDIKKAFKRNVLIDAGKIDVSVEDGIAHLTGAVPVYSMKEEAFNVAMMTGGIVDVKDDITIA